MILKLVPRDLLYQLPVPKRIRDYLNTPFYYSEAIADWKVAGGSDCDDDHAEDNGTRPISPASGVSSSGDVPLGERMEEQDANANATRTPDSASPQSQPVP